MLKIKPIIFCTVCLLGLLSARAGTPDEFYRRREYILQQNLAREMLLQAKLDHENQQAERLKLAQEQLKTFRQIPGAMDREQVVAEDGRVNLKTADLPKEKVDGGGRRLIASIIILTVLLAAAFGVHFWTKEEIDG